MITRAYSSSNSSGFNSILKKFYEMICEIIVSKTLCGIFLIFCRSSFINTFFWEEQFFGALKSPKPKYLETYFFKKNLQTVLKIISAQISWKIFFSKSIFFKGLERFFATAKLLIWGSFFSSKNNFIVIFKCDYLISK